MWLYNQFRDSKTGTDTDVCDPCSTSICEEIRKMQGKAKSKSCKVCTSRSIYGKGDSGNRKSALGVLLAIRNELANYMATQGVSQKPYGFLTLVKDLFQRLMSTCFTILGLAQSCGGHLFGSISTILWIFISVLRFSLDSILDICMEQNGRLFFQKLAILIIELMCIAIVLQYTVGMLLSLTFRVLKFLIHLVL